ncbi:MAG: hypothetical protein LBB81_02250 [Treponema sp.]|nr:hypothetical protein [Treponema sp.]
MKKSVFIFVVLVSTFAITGCETGTGGGGGGIFFPINPTRKFWAQNAVTQAFYQLDAERLAENSRCEVWVEKGSGVNAATANSIANEYSNNIYTKMINNFGWNENIEVQKNQEKNMNTMEIAHWLTTGNSNNAKLTILLLDIKDSYQPGVNESYVAGYFWPYDILSSLLSLPAGYRSNELDMIYIDINPGLKNSERISEAYMTLAHEMQHLMNFVSSVVYRVNESGTLYTMDTWIDEGLSAAAEWVYSGRYSDDRVGWFYYNGNGKDMHGKIDVGNNFYVWGNRVSDKDPYPILDDYATVYLFFQWLRLQSGSSIYKEIIKSENYDYRAVINAFKNTYNYPNWGDMLSDWLAANNINSAAGRDGYKNDQILKNITASYAPAGSTYLSLYPGEGVYSYSNTSPSVTSSGNIKYKYFSGNKTLLTYNVNDKNYVGEGENISSLIESGTITGVKPPSSIRMSGNYDIKPGSYEISGPFRIGMGDVTRMNKNSNRFNFDITKFERVFIDE